VSCALLGCQPGGNDQPPLNGIGGPYDCVYPANASGDLSTGEIIPQYVWENAVRADGSTFTFNLEEFHCSPEYEQYSSLVIAVSAGWCPACPGYIQSVNALQPELEDQGALVLYVETQNPAFEPATGEDAADFLEPLLEGGPGIRVGDGENSPTSDIDRQITSYPTGFFVRRRDMRIVLAERDANVGQLPYMQLAANPEADWAGELGGGLEGNCGPDDEEIGEPNDTPASPTTIGVGTIEGGICDSSYKDYYVVDVDGPWHLDLEFTHATGDLDVFVIDRLGYTRITGSASLDDNEALDYEGNSLIAIIGQQRSTAPYRLTITPR
jgi:thiol-disulfide isomerase/thioredoxin